jgi:membrane-bound ClpP family serine protease
MGPLALAYLLIAAGVLILLAELLFPSGIFFIVALCAIVGGVVVTFLYSEDPYTSWLTLFGVVVVLPALGTLLLRIWPRTPMGRRLFLTATNDDATVASMPVNVELEQLRGRIGRTLGPLRPSGVADFAGRRVDVISEGMMVEDGRWVRCIDVKAGKVIVRAVDTPEVGDFENIDLG